MADVDRLLDRLTEDQTREHTAGERVARAVAVDNVVDLRRGVRKGLRAVLHSTDRRLAAVRDEHGARLVDHRRLVGDRLRDLAEVARLEVGRLRPRLGLGLVADHELGVGHHGVHLRLEELRDERRREVEGEHLAGLLGVLGEHQRALHTVRQEEAAQVEVGSGLDRGLDVGRLEVRLVKLLRSTQVGAQRAVVAGDHHGARAGGHRIVHLVERLEALAFVGGAQLLREVVLADAPDVRGGVLREDVLHGARRVLRRAAGDVGHLVVLHDVLVNGELLLVREHRVVRLQAVLLEHLLAVADLHVEQRVAHGNELERLRVDHRGRVGEGTCAGIT